jgi:DNA repair ATPase RecN
MQEKLYEIASSMSKLGDVVEDPKELQTYLDGVQMQLEEKATNIFKVMKNLEAPVIAIDEEIKRLTALKRSYQSKAQSLKKYVSYQMEINKIEKIESDIVTFSFRKSSAVNVSNEEIIPEKFIKEKVVKQVDKTAIKKAIADGEEVAGASIEVRKNLQIK